MRPKHLKVVVQWFSGEVREDSLICNCVKTCLRAMVEMRYQIRALLARFEVMVGLEFHANMRLHVNDYAGCGDCV